MKYFYSKLALLSAVVLTNSVSFANDPHSASAAIALSPVFTTSAPFYTTADAATGLRSQQLKVLIDSKDDAAAFIASEGQFRTIKVLRAFELIRKINPKLSNSDMELAQAILEL